MCQYVVDGSKLYVCVSMLWMAVAVCVCWNVARREARRKEERRIQWKARTAINRKRKRGRRKKGRREGKLEVDK